MIHLLQYIFARTLRGYVFIVPILLVYFLLLSILRKKQKSLHIAAVFVFSFYLIALITGTGIGSPAFSSFSPQIMLIPFRDLVVAPRHFILNVATFIPVGFFLSLMYKKCRNIKVIAAVGFLFSLCIELLQMFGWGATETDDLIANTSGVCLGYYVYWVTKKVLHKDLGKHLQAVNINDTVEVVLLLISAFLIMAIMEPMVHSG